MTTNRFNDITTHPNYPFMEAKNTSFGIELEICVPQQNWPYGTGRYHNGSTIPGYPRGWNVQSDSSIQAPVGYLGIEIVSPKLTGFDGIVQLVQVLDDLNQREAIVNRSTGLHIHVDGRNLDIRDIKKVKQMYVQYEKLFFGAMGDIAVTRYQNNSYCKPSHKWHNGQDNSDRYRSLNLKNWYSYDKKKTVEFRLFAGNLNPETVVTYVYMCVGLVVRSRNSTRVHNFRTEPRSLMDLCKRFISNVLSKPVNQIVPDYVPERGDSLYRILFENVPQSTVTL